MTDIKNNDFIRADRITLANHGKPTFLPIGHYALINSKSPLFKFNPKIAIFGLGSCIALIIYDNKNKIYAMSHILLPHDMKKTHGFYQKFPQKYAATAVKDLINKLLAKGAEKKKLRAIIIGGAQIFNDHFNNIGTRNIEVVKQELRSFNVKIKMEEIGGNVGRNVIYEPMNNFVYIKSTGESNFNRLI